MTSDLPAEPRAGRLLVATPGLLDPNFYRAVVFLLAHTSAGALGLVLNRPSDHEVESLLPGWGDAASEPARVFLGGPVSLDSVIGLGRTQQAAVPADASFTPIIDSVGTIDLHRDVGGLGVPVDAVRLFAGSAGWGSGQLEAEIAEGAWFVVDAEPADIFTSEPERLWRNVLRRQPGTLAWYANAEGDIRFN